MAKKIKVKISRNQIFAFLCFLILATNGILIFYKNPYFNYPFSYYKLQDTKQLTENVQKNYEASKAQAAQLEKQAKQAEEKAKRIREQQKELVEALGKENMKWDIHIPSILILLEQNATYFGLDFKLHYNQIRTEKGDQGMLPEEPSLPDGSQQNLGVAPESSPSPSTDNQQPDNSTDNGTANENTQKINLVLSQIENPHINGIDVTIIPIEIEGTYETTREYLNFLDSVDFIEPRYIELTSTGSGIKAFIILYVFSKQGGDPLA